ncbi:hypothetical protein PHYSODRAFT_415892, partial [Phytophthora sojae]
LRVTEPNFDTEDRSFTEFVLAHLKDKIKDMRIKAWLTLGKSDEEVMKVLGIKQGLTRAQLKAHPKFRIFQRFQVKKWLKEGASTSKVWDDLGLKNLRGRISEADGYETYVHLVWALGDKVTKF